MTSTGTLEYTISPRVSNLSRESERELASASSRQEQKAGCHDFVLHFGNARGPSILARVLTFPDALIESRADAKAVLELVHGFPLP
eukprot:CAMPEP_0173126902 /NCGR_PEP_ID=MMETSP1102-20130122/57453_1 /TAXON_ID=49646 /ORGANISM="Geminigera sp., Strain Caron Lab Isolate" /LENGTH=85 /DNA_ID=CAMNT_0014036379 /DNA_START=480 /DNA_END=737 /DNA_ORIENTATION=-